MSWQDADESYRNNGIIKNDEAKKICDRIQLTTSAIMIYI